MKKCATCSAPIDRRAARFCKACYQKFRAENRGSRRRTCRICNSIINQRSAGLCTPCYNNSRTGLTIAERNALRRAKRALLIPRRIRLTKEESNARRNAKRLLTKEHRKGVCPKCTKFLIILNKGLCSHCYHKSIELPGVCSDCGGYKPIRNKKANLCAKCYNTKLRALPKCKVVKAEWYQRNKKRLMERMLYRIRTIPQVMLAARLRKKLHKVMKNHIKSASMLMLLGCSLEFFTQHISKMFAEGMSFYNYGKWHLDHIIPISAWDLTNLEQQKMCFHYSNIRPAWAFDNLSKWNKVPAWFNLEDYREAFKPFTQMEAP